ncbi:serine hydrolase [Azospirillum sp. TSH100]|uniref:serine hydrolase n=1 Tax=Azospirillum sp. TSH100 TaxID=652764 RepID=UPI0013049573|nr:serine hydrolase [Azospirillum sp. TSH100]
MRHLLAGVALFAVGVADQAQAADPTQLSRVLQSVVDMTASQGTFQGVSVGVGFGNGQTWLGAGGYRDAARTQPLSPNDQFRVGSHSKTFTGTAVLQLVDQGVINLNDTLAKWAPELKIPNSDQISIRNLLSMTSGIPDYLNAQSLHQANATVLQEWSNFSSPNGPYATANYTPSQLVQAVVQTPNQTYGTIGQMSYSNTNFAILGLIAERASCQTAGGCRSIETLVNDGIIKRLGLTNTVFPTNNLFTASYAENAQYVMNTASVYGGSNNTSYNVTFADPKVPWAAGAIISTAPDELVWLRQLATDAQGLLSPATQLQRLYAPIPGSIGGIPGRYGLAIYYMPSVGTGTELIGHSGEIGGYTTSIFYSPTLDVAFAVDFSGGQANAASWYPLYGATNLYGSAITSQGNFNSVAILWALERNLRIAMEAQGSCTGFGTASLIAGGSATCTGDSVRTAPITVDNGALTVAPSNRTIGNYVLTSDSTMTYAEVARPSISFFGSQMAGIDLTGGSTLTLQPGSIIEMTGVSSDAIRMSGSGNAVTVQGSILAYGANTVAIRGGDAADRVTIASTASVQGDVALGGGANELRVDGTITGNVPMAGSATRLEGTGVITGSVGGGGVVAPGPGIGMLTVGSYTGADTTLEVETASGGRSDLLFVAGPAALNGGALRVTAGTATDGVYPVLSAGNLTGTFASVTSTDRTAVGASYSSAGVQVATVNPISIDQGTRTAMLGMTRHLDTLEERASAFAGRSRPVTVAGLPETKGPTMTDTGGGSGSGRDIVNVVPRAPVELSGDRGAALWSKAFYNVGQLASKDGEAGANAHGIGIAVGADVAVTDSVGVGGMVAYHDLDSKGRDGSGAELESHAYYAGLYGVAQVGDYTMDASLLAGFGNNDTKRPTFVGGTLLQATGGYDDARVAARLAVSRAFDAETATLVPRLALSWSHLHSDGYTESGAGAGSLSVDSRSASQLRSEASLAVRRTFDVDGGILFTELRAGVAHETMLGGRDATVRLSGLGTAFGVRGNDADGWVFPVAARLETKAADDVGMFASYGGEFSSRYTDHRFNAGVRIRF